MTSHSVYKNTTIDKYRPRDKMMTMIMMMMMIADLQRVIHRLAKSYAHKGRWWVW